MNQFAQQLCNGLVLGATYALIALGYTMVYGVIQLINFAHGEIFMLGAFGGLALYLWMPGVQEAPALVALPLVLVAAILAATLAAVLMERVAYRPLRNAPRLAPLITAIGVSVVLQEAVRLYYPGAISPPNEFPRLFPAGAVHIGGVTIDYVAIFTVAVAVALMIGLQIFVGRSRTGRAMRATAADPTIARLMGIDTNRVIVVTFALGGALAGVAGVLQGMRLGGIQFNMGFAAGITAFTAAVLGGIGNIQGAVIGGFVLGVVEALATQYLPQGSAYHQLYAYVVLILVLVFRPTGLFGEREAVRA